jgi:methylenetetrahydrofolate dehydrogenase (NADP+)/methenyltetrahydrofolate cyclohydrolase
MTAQILDGKGLAARLADSVSAQVAAGTANGIAAPGLTVVIVGDDPASQVYVRHKLRMCERTGIRSTLHRLPSATSAAELLALIDQLNADDAVDGILVQLPLPPEHDVNAVIERIDPAKDVDGFHPCNVGRLATRQPGLRPCTPHGIMTLLEDANIRLPGMEALVIGASNIVGRPMLLELLQAGATVTTCHSRSRNLADHVARAELVVVAVGKAGLVHGDWIRPGAVVVDVGMNRGADGKLTGDVEFAAARERAAWITPVPGGVGPMTVVTLMQNTLAAAARRRGA